MKKYVIAAVCSAAFVCAAAAQNSVVAEPNPEVVGNDSAVQQLREVSLDRFVECSYLSGLRCDFFASF